MVPVFSEEDLDFVLRPLVLLKVVLILVGDDERVRGRLPNVVPDAVGVDVVEENPRAKAEVLPGGQAADARGEDGGLLPEASKSIRKPYWRR